MELLHHAAECARRAPAGVGALIMVLAAELEISVDEATIGQAIDNLVANARRHLMPRSS